MAASSLVPVELHPLVPFLPENARVLMLGSFPPKRERWCMDFFYPNWQNDMWRIMGLVFHDDKDRFADVPHRRFVQERIEAFLRQKGIALYDTATAVRRLKDNASDKFLEVVEPTDLPALFERVPQCCAVVATGQKAVETFCTVMEVEPPRVGGFTPFIHAGRQMRFYRMPSSSRAYPLALSGKAAAYASLFRQESIL